MEGQRLAELEAFAGWFRHALKQSNMGQTAFARKIGVSRQGW